MKLKMSLLLIMMGTSLILLLGCSGGSSQDWNSDLQGAEKIEVVKDSNTIATISGEEEITQFVDSLELDKWEMGSIPSGASKGLIYKLYSNETVKLGQSADDVNLIEVGTITIYENVPYIELNLKGFGLSFKVSERAADYLSNSY
ncbi:hypothetical protein [Alkalihalophilus marmarensis]|uniref:Uncharacterized protein n=1 Tax=Alkalihalophilus marmarensis DSM 21297 TaxID=1188261 RepID=U6SKV9_9BACI|nr:hypothetical protein [Alkalihalophilus marmarensis]ERN52017.1 hypothetical protein A33I_18160 [Alkalihalophilus marmarensis DSM 21297]